MTNGAKASDELVVGQLYTRKELARKFAVRDSTIRTGIFQPQGYDSIWLFITEHKTPDRTQYKDWLDGATLHMDGQTSGRKDDLVIKHAERGLELLLFYRSRRDEHPGYAFRYEGMFRYIAHKGKFPAHFVLQRVPSEERRYWVFFANPRIYRVESALENLERDTWTVGRSDVRKGDRGVFWRGMKDGKRGVVGLAEVISDPKRMAEPRQSLPFYVRAPKGRERRVWLRIFKPNRAPLWVDEDQTGLLRSLSVANAHGGTVYRLRPDQWHLLVEILGGWEEDSSEDQALWALESASVRRARGQGFRVSPEIRRAIDVYAMRKAEEYFRNAGYETKDVHKNRPFDLLCSRGSARLFVEVKGTRSKGEQVILTSGEVKFAKKDPMHMVLYVQRLVRVTYRNGRPVVSGGRRLVKRQWTVDERSLEPLCFTYKLKR
jgi:hypothetical protein